MCINKSPFFLSCFVSAFLFSTTAHCATSDYNLPAPTLISPADPVGIPYGGISGMYGEINAANISGVFVPPDNSTALPLKQPNNIDNSTWKGAIDGYVGVYFPVRPMGGILSDIEFFYMDSWQKNFPSIIQYPTSIQAQTNSLSTNVSSSAIFLNVGPTWHFSDNVMAYIKAGGGFAFNNASSALTIASSHFTGRNDIDNFAWKVSFGAVSRTRTWISVITAFDVVSLGPIQYGLKENPPLTAGIHLQSSNLYAFLFSLGIQTPTF